MIILVIGGLLLGAIFGRFFTVLVLVPAFALSLAIVVASSAYFGHTLLRALLEFAVLITSLQIGYVSGVVSHAAEIRATPASRRIGNPAARAQVELLVP